MKESHYIKLREALETLLIWFKILNFIHLVNCSTNKPIRKFRSTTSVFVYIRGCLGTPMQISSQFLHYFDYCLRDFDY